MSHAQTCAVQVTQPRQRDTEAVVFTWRQNVKLRKYRHVLPGGVTQVIVHPSEEAMLQGWLAWLHTADPDILNVFQASKEPSRHRSNGARTIKLCPQGVDCMRSGLLKHVQHGWHVCGFMKCMRIVCAGGTPSLQVIYHPMQGSLQLSGWDDNMDTLQVRDTLGALADRCAVLKIDGAALHVSRLLRRESRGLAVKRITMYSPNWVKSQNRMSSTSNQACCPLSTFQYSALQEGSRLSLRTSESLVARSPS